MLLDGQSRKIYNDVFRTSDSQLGFYFVDLGDEIDSKIFRKIMVDLKGSLTKHCKIHQRKWLTYQSLGRFNQQKTSKFHKDTADSSSFLMLGYEPTKVGSKVRVADFDKYFNQKGKEPHGSLGEDHHITSAAGEIIPKSFVTELNDFPKENYRILLLNNSEALGVFHSAEIGESIEGEMRVINYMMMYMHSHCVEESYNDKEIENFINTDKVDV